MNRVTAVAFFALIAAVSSSAATVTGKVSDIWDDGPIAGVRVTAVNEKKQAIATVDTAANGTYQLNVPSGAVLELKFEKDRYQVNPTWVRNVDTRTNTLINVNTQLLREGASRTYYRAVAERALNRPEIAAYIERVYHTLEKEDRLALDREVAHERAERAERAEREARDRPERERPPK